MSAGPLRSRLALFVTVVLLTVAAVTATGVVTDQGQTAKPTVDQPHFQPNATAVDELDQSGEIEFSSTGSKTVLIDMAHGNGVSEADLQPIVSALTAAGHTVTYHEGAGQFADSPDAALRSDLQDADAFIVAEPTQRYTAGEADAVTEFADAGGRVMFAAGPSGGDVSDVVGGLLGDASGAEAGQGEFAAVTSPLGIAYDTGSLYDMESVGSNYRTIDVTPASETALTDGVDRVVLDSPTAVVADGETLLATSETAEHEESRHSGEFGVAVRSDNAVAVGDTGFMSSETATIADNEVFIGNLLEFLVGGEKTPGEPSVPDDATGGQGAAGGQTGTGQTGGATIMP